MKRVEAYDIDYARLSFEFAFENWVISCFKWFSKVFESLKPRSRVFSTSSLPRYSTAFFLLVILCLHPRSREGKFCAASLVPAVTR